MSRQKIIDFARNGIDVEELKKYRKYLYSIGDFDSADELGESLKNYLNDPNDLTEAELLTTLKYLV